MVKMRNDLGLREWGFYTYKKSNLIKEMKIVWLIETTFSKNIVSMPLLVDYVTPEV